MHLCLVRHAIAEERSLRWPDDALRPLTPEGRAKMERAARGLTRLLAPGAVLTSPLVRAAQTAEIIAAAAGLPRIEEVAALATGDDESLVRAVNRCGAQVVVAVGHEPTISQTLSRLLTGSVRVSSVFKKGTAALVGFENEAEVGGGWLEWLVQPAALRMLAEARSAD